MKIPLILVATVCLFPFFCLADGKKTNLQQFFDAKPPYSSKTAKLAYQALTELRTMDAFKKRGYAFKQAKSWQDKLMVVMRDGKADSDLIKNGFETISVFQLVGLGRDWSRGDNQTSNSNKKLEAEFKRLVKAQD